MSSGKCDVDAAKTKRIINEDCLLGCNSVESPGKLYQLLVENGGIKKLHSERTFCSCLRLEDVFMFERSLCKYFQRNRRVILSRNVTATKRRVIAKKQREYTNFTRLKRLFKASAAVDFDVPNILQPQQVTGQLPRPQLCGYYNRPRNITYPHPKTRRERTHVPSVRRLLRRAPRRPTRTSGSTCTSRTGTSRPLAVSADAEPARPVKSSAPRR